MIKKKTSKKNDIATYINFIAKWVGIMKFCEKKFVGAQIHERMAPLLYIIYVW